MDDRIRITIVEKKNRERWPEANCRKNLPGVAEIALEHAYAARWKGGRAERLERNRAAKGAN